MDTPRRRVRARDSAAAATTTTNTDDDDFNIRMKRCTLITQQCVGSVI